MTKSKTAKSIISIKFHEDVDTYPDLSFLGEYETEPGPDDRTIDRAERGDQGRHEPQYFVAAMSGAETGNPKSVEQDYERMQDYNRGEWHMCFCNVIAKIEVNGVLQTICSGGLGGVESDSDKSYFGEIMKDELAQIVSILKDLGFTDDQIADAEADCLEKGV